MKLISLKSMSICAVFALSLSASRPGLAWHSSTNPDGTVMKQPVKIVDYSINPAGAVPGFAQAVQAAMQSWSVLPGADIAFNYEGASDLTSQQDFKNAIVWNTTGADLPSEVLALTINYTYQDGRIAEFDMEFNGTHPFTTDSSPTGFDLQSIAVHEAGHAIGFNHEDELPSAMKSTIGPGQVKRILYDTDIAGAQTIYPGTGCLGSRKGDVNGDNVVDITDAVTVLQASVGLHGLSNACAIASADTNCDGRVQIEDAINILRNAVIGEPFPACQE